MQPMELYVIRHGIAEDAGPGQDDAERALTSDGEKKLRREVKGLRELALDVRARADEPVVARETDGEAARVDHRA